MPHIARRQLLRLENIKALIDVKMQVLQRVCPRQSLPPLPSARNMEMYTTHM